ncbi:MAG: signal recognition particle protein [Bacteroidetes bacterium]|jgi:signal recognition particle subunit SRP54|nr:signal recognition particle protein [Bacteroidota bacterium]
MFESLSDKLELAFKRLKGQGRINELNIADTLKDVRRALVDADVNYKIAKEFVDTVKEKALGANVIKAVSPGQMMVKIVHDELVSLMGNQAEGINLSDKPAVVLMAGLQGSGKTTFSGKLANHLKKKGREVMLVACDVYRPAAIAQLHTVAEAVGVDFYSEPDNKNPIDIAQKAVHAAKVKGISTVIIDTAGRLAVDEQMMDEIGRIKAAVRPGEILFVVDAMTGQDAVNTAEAFNAKLDFNGVVLTKLDGDTRGGAALSIRRQVNKPIKFVGTGEKMDALDVFYPERMATRILGMGDIVSLVEKAQETIDEEEAKRLQSRFKKNQFDFEDFLGQIRQIKKMGNFKDLLGMMPGIGKAVKDMDIQEDALKHTEAMILSMTPVERRNPRMLDAKRRKRIAQGSGREVSEVNQLVKQLEQMQKLMKTINKQGQKGGQMRNAPRFN